jgi:membrane protein
VKSVDRAVAALERATDGARTRSRLFDHAWRARERYNEVLAGRLAAAISYYGFFAAFSLAVVLYSILGYVLTSTQSTFVDAVNQYLNQNLTWVAQTAEEVGRGEVTVIGGIALVLTGVGWVESLRSSQRAVWRLDQHPGNWFIRRLVDLGMLVGLGVLLGLSLAMTAAIDELLDRIVGREATVVGATVLRSSGPVLEFLVNLLLAAALLAAVPRLHLGLRRLLPATLVTGVGIQLLNTLGRWYIARSQHSPAYQLVAGAVGLLVYLYLLNQLILFGAALAATANNGTVVDLAAGPVDQPRPADEAAPARPEDIGAPSRTRGAQPP